MTLIFLIRLGGSISSKTHPLNPYEGMGGGSMNVTPLRPKPTSELKATSLSTLVPSPIQPSPSLSLPPGLYYGIVDRNNPNIKFFYYPQMANSFLFILYI